MINFSSPQSSKPVKDLVISPLTAHQIKLFNRVIAFYCTSFYQNKKVQDLLKKRGITTNQILHDYRIGFSSGGLLDTLPDDGKVISQLRKIKILNDHSKETFYQCITIPVFNPEDIPCGLYGRRINNRGAPNIYLSSFPGSILNGTALKPFSEIILTKSIIDFLTLINAGIKNTIPCHSFKHFATSLFPMILKNKMTCYICFGSKKEAQSLAQSIHHLLVSSKLNSYIISLAKTKSPTQYFLSSENPKEAFIAELENAVSDESQGTYAITKKDRGFNIQIEDRSYEIRNIVKQAGRLKAVVKGIQHEDFHIDTVNFYAFRSRNLLIRGLSSLFDIKEDQAAQDVSVIFRQAEQLQEIRISNHEMDTEDKKRALKFLQNADMFNEILNDFETLGYTGEEMNKLLCYIAAVSRKMDTPLSVMIQSRSAAGKSYLQDMILSLVPEEDFIKYTRLTEQALFYTDKTSLKHKILAIEELDGMDKAVYSVRSIQSSKHITIAYTGKDEVTGRQKTMVNKVEGPLMVFITTTQIDIDGETASRFVFISIDESEEMTKKIHAKQRHYHTKEGMLSKLSAERIRKKHHNASRLLKPLHVFNPYAELLSFTSKSLRARRDHTKYLNLILAIAFFFQYQKKIHTLSHNGEAINYVNVDLEDIRKANTIATDALGRTLDELSCSSRTLLGLIRKMAEAQNHQPGSCHFTRKDIREFCGWSDFQVRTHMKQLEELEYIYAIRGKKGREYVYELIFDGSNIGEEPFVLGLANPDYLEKQAVKAGINFEG